MPGGLAARRARRPVAPAARLAVARGRLGRLLQPRQGPRRRRTARRSRPCSAARSPTARRYTSGTALKRVAILRGHDRPRAPGEPRRRQLDPRAGRGAARAGAGRDRRRRDHRIVDRVPPDQARRDRRASCSSGSGSPRGRPGTPAGLVSQVRGTHALTELSRINTSTYASLPSETGVETGFRRVGSLTRRAHAGADAGAAHRRRHAPRVRRRVPGARAGSRCCDWWPIAHVDDLVGATVTPTDGTVNPGEAALSLAKGAHDRGAVFAFGVTVTGFRLEGGAVTAVETDKGTVEADTVVLAAGLWTSELARMAGTSVALYPAEHVWVMTDPVPGAEERLPFLRDLDGYFYVRHHGGRLVVGAFEPKGKPKAPARRADRRLRRVRRGLGPLRAGARGRARAAPGARGRSGSSTTCAARRASRPTRTCTSASSPRCVGCSSRRASTRRASSTARASARRSPSGSSRDTRRWT